MITICFLSEINRFAKQITDEDEINCSVDMKSHGPYESDGGV